MPTATSRGEEEGGGSAVPGGQRGIIPTEGAQGGGKGPTSSPQRPRCG